MYLYIRGAYFAFFWMLFSTIALYFFIDLEVRYLHISPPILAVIAAFITNKPWTTKNLQNGTRSSSTRAGSSGMPQRLRRSATLSKTPKPT